MRASVQAPLLLLFQFLGVVLIIFLSLQAGHGLWMAASAKHIAGTSDGLIASWHPTEASQSALWLRERIKYFLLATACSATAAECNQESGSELDGTCDRDAGCVPSVFPKAEATNRYKCNQVAVFIDLFGRLVTNMAEAFAILVLSGCSPARSCSSSYTWADCCKPKQPSRSSYQSNRNPIGVRDGRAARFQERIASATEGSRFNQGHASRAWGGCWKCTKQKTTNSNGNHEDHDPGTDSLVAMAM